MSSVTYMLHTYWWQTLPCKMPPANQDAKHSHPDGSMLCEKFGVQYLDQTTVFIWKTTRSTCEPPHVARKKMACLNSATSSHKYSQFDWTFWGYLNGWLDWLIGLDNVFNIQPETLGVSVPHCQTNLIRWSSTHHYVHVGQSELSVEAPSVDRTHILQSSKGRQSDGASSGQNWQAISEPSINPFLIKQN